MLKLTNVLLGYPGNPILLLDKLELTAGKSCLITGASGSGKTTLLYAVAGLHMPLEGSIRINGTEMTQLSESERDHFRGKYIGMIFQTLHLVRSLSVMDNLLLAPYAANLPQKQDKALGLLDRLGLTAKMYALPQTLSQGQAQRVAIARSVMISPSLILADEPTSSLDDANAEAVITLIQEVARESGASLLVSTHDARIKHRFDQVITLENS